MTEFGDFTIRVKVNGTDQNIKVSDFDHDNSGTLSQAELNEILAQYGDALDSFQTETLTAMVADNGEITSEELARFEQEELINEELKKYTEQQVSIDFSGNLAGRQQFVRDALTEFRDGFVSDYSGDISQMYNQFKPAIQAEYDRIKSEMLGNSKASNAAETVKVEVLSRHVDLDANVKTRIYNALLEEANKFLEENPDATEEQIAAHLRTYLNTTFENDNTINNAITQWNQAATLAADGDGYEADELLYELKPNAKNLISAAYNAGIAFKVDGVEYSLSQMKGYIDSFTDGQALVDFMANLTTAISRAAGVTQEAMLVQGAGKYVIEVNSATGTATGMSNIDSDAVDKAVDEVIESIYRQFSITDSDKWRIELGKTLTKEAIRFFNSNAFSDVDDFKTQLESHLMAFIADPLCNLKESASDWQTTLDGFTSLNPTDTELNGLFKLLEEIWSAAEKAGVKFTDINGNPLDLETVKNSYSIYNMGDLKKLIQTMINQIKANQNNLVDLYKTNGTGEISITLSENGALDDKRFKIINKVIDALIGTLKDNTNATQIAARLREVAFYYTFNVYKEAQVTSGGGSDGFFGGGTTVETGGKTFETCLTEYLTAYMKSPVSSLVLPGIMEENESYSCNPEELQQLKTAFTEILEKANAAHIQFVDKNGTAITTSILSKYNTENAHDLWKLINSMLEGIKYFEKFSLEEIFEKFPDGVIKLMVTEQGATPEEYLDETIIDLDYGNISEDLSHPTIGDLRKKIADKIKKQLENKAKRICKRLGIDWESLGKKTFDACYLGAEESCIPTGNSFFGLINAFSITCVPRDIAEKIASKTISLFSKWAHQISGK